MVENETEIKRGIIINADGSVKFQNNIMSAKKYYIWNRAICSCEKVKYLGSINDDSLVIHW